ncbi:MAG: nucleotidyltransferase domain-containing protein [Syntrophomonas sp.]|nr:nucleotidyltransferase domain-containing protein [Syntrophomonas sp.]
MRIEIDYRKIEEIVQRYQLRLLVYYGSYARQDDYNPERSDIDIAFMARYPLSFQQTYDLLTDLILLHRKSNIHLVNLQTASGLLKEAIAKDGQVLYENENGYFESICPYLYKCYYESKKFRQIQREIFQKKLAEEMSNV